MARPPKPGKPPKPPKQGKLGPLGGVLDRITASRLCYGDAIVVEGRTVVPIARIRAAGGGGYGSGEAAESGGGGGGYIEAIPIGYLEITREGTRYAEIRDPEQLQRTLKAAAAAITTVAAGIAGLRRLRGHGSGRPAGLLRR